jgi:hypothetical protein
LGIPSVIFSSSWHSSAIELKCTELELAYSPSYCQQRNCQQQASYNLECFISKLQLYDAPGYRQYNQQQQARTVLFSHQDMGAHRLRHREAPWTRKVWKRIPCSREEKPLYRSAEGRFNARYCLSQSMCFTSFKRHYPAELSLCFLRVLSSSTHSSLSLTRFSSRACVSYFLILYIYLSVYLNIYICMHTYIYIYLLYIRYFSSLSLPRRAWSTSCAAKLRYRLSIYNILYIYQKRTLCVCMFPHTHRLLCVQSHLKHLNILRLYDCVCVCVCFLILINYYICSRI